MEVPTEIRGQSQSRDAVRIGKLFCFFHKHDFKKIQIIFPSFLPQNTLATLPRDPRGSVEVLTEVRGRSQP